MDTEEMNDYEKAKKILKTHRFLPLINKLHKWHLASVLKNDKKIAQFIRSNESDLTSILPRRLLWSTDRWKVTSHDLLYKFPFCQYPGCNNLSQVGHHLNYYNLAKEKEGSDVIALCHSCHSDIHFGNKSDRDLIEYQRNSVQQNIVIPKLLNIN